MSSFDQMSTLEDLQDKLLNEENKENNDEEQGYREFQRQGLDTKNEAIKYMMEELEFGRRDAEVMASGNDAEIVEEIHRKIREGEYDDAPELKDIAAKLTNPEWRKEMLKRTGKDEGDEN